jgi:2-(3-amino-3-carboxypropyl)histidine synthase
MLRDETIRMLKKAGARRVLVQVPEGLKPRARDIAAALEKEGFVPFISVEPCFGACDLIDREAVGMADALLHIGHSDYGLKASVPVVYEEMMFEHDPVPLLSKHLNSLKPYTNIGLISTVQHLPGLAKAKVFLESHGKSALLGKPSRALHPGQVLGCDYSAAKSIEGRVDCFLFIGSGRFHPLGLAMETAKPVLFLDTEAGSLTNLSEEKKTLERLRGAGIAKASQAKAFGILISTKPGQAHPDLAMEAKGRLESLGKKAFILVANQVTPEKLLGLGVEALVNTACPRIREDARAFRMPIISPSDIDYFKE